jgi:hypothetical protein
LSNTVSFRQACAASLAVAPQSTTSNPQPTEPLPPIPSSRNE